MRTTHTRVIPRSLGTIVGLSLVMAVTTGAASSATAPSVSHEGFVSVIVQGANPNMAAAAVTSTGGRVTRMLPIVDGVAARISRAAFERLRTSPYLNVTTNNAIEFNQEDYTLQPQRVQKNAGSDRLWTEGITGKGVTVALVDTGVHADHPDLDGRVVHCEDLSHEAVTEAECEDTFGHGTFMAGLIAGDGTSSDGAFKGAAPEAKIVAVKVAGFDGATDVSNVLAGIQWAVAHKSKYGIRVMNLSIGTDATQTPKLSPLNYAVQRAWKAGITVVVSAGNGGPSSRTILKPADDPFVVTVGASNDEGTVAIEDDAVPVFSSRGPTKADGSAKPDVVAPGTHTISLRSPGSAIDQEYGSTAVVQDDYFRGTGTSMAAATTSGIVAQILQKTPSLTPDQVKNRLVSTARRIAVTDKYSVGKGLVDAYAAAKSTSTAKANQGLLYGLGGLSTGLGLIGPDRGSLGLGVVTPQGEGDLAGENKAQHQASLVSLSNPLGLLPWTSLVYTTVGWDPVTWLTTSFATTDWSGVRWKETSWDGVRWKETSWDGVRWKGTAWENSDWEGVRWKGTEWDGVRWKATSWQTRWYAAAWK